MHAQTDLAADPAPSLTGPTSSSWPLVKYIVRSRLGYTGIDSTLAVTARDETEARMLAERFWRNFYWRTGRSVEPFTVTAVQRRLASIPTRGSNDLSGIHASAA